MAEEEKTEEISAYDGSSITVLEGLEAVRKRPGMYIGSTGLRGLHHLIYEVVDNSIDECLAGFCKNVWITMESDNSVTVIDDGRGIPVDNMEKYDKPAAEVVLTMLHAGGKFDNKGYKVSGGLHGVGLSVVNALSEWLILEVGRTGKIYQQHYKRGFPTTDLEVIGEGRRDGTIIRFLPDTLIFESLEYDFDTVLQRMREMAFLNEGLRIELLDKRDDPPTQVVFRYTGGIRISSPTSTLTRSPCSARSST